MRTIEGNLLGAGKRFGLVASRFNDFITKKLVEGAIDTLVRHGVQDADISLAWVPGSFEVPVVALSMAKSKNFDAVICLGTIIRGGTVHFEYIANECAKGVASVSLQTGIPCIFGVITADSIEQAVERAGTKQGNKGKDAALNAIEMANLLEKIK
jgi:6,7-dimethyl-8-ribityllumazine synthase